MKSIWFHMQGYRDLPDDFHKKYESVWVTPPTDELCDPKMVAKYLRWNVEELELADEVGFDGLGINEHHQNAYGFPVSPNLIASILARRNSDAALVVLGNTLPLYNPPMRVAEEFALLDCLSGGRLVAGFPVGSPMDTVGCYGIPPTQVRPRYYEAHDLIKKAWTHKGTFAFNGQFTKLRYANLWPKPLQNPHPPVWLAGGGSVETWKFATDNDYTYSYLSFGGHKAGKAMMQGYWDQIEKAGLDDNPYRAGFAQLVVVADTDAMAEKLYLKHIRNFYTKSLHIPSHFQAIPGFMTKKSVEYNMRKGAKALNATYSDPANATWKDFTETDQVVIGGSPDTVAARLEEAVRNLRVGHLMIIMQIQSMDRELTEYNTRLFADKVLPRIRNIWDKEGYVDHWWPQGATRNQVAAPSREAAE
ncbi:LLM class flavin-dependent oxidoreductase [Zavarzinia sp. CC-PAN008]|uniref:LLM class flavin-dependent oxidoreductase n=1 Tax=Zavarzinia sp. CC-PAN008 TaxID=3243332 RepID=UPI003F744DEA